MCDDSFEFQKKLKTISENFEIFNEEITVKMSYTFPDTYTASEDTQDLQYKDIEASSGEEVLERARNLSKTSKT